jgi:hypothetical protein
MWIPCPQQAHLDAGTLYHTRESFLRMPVEEAE